MPTRKSYPAAIQNIEFAGKTFSAGTPVQASYRFYSYRLGVFTPASLETQQSVSNSESRFMPTLNNAIRKATSAHIQGCWMSHVAQVLSLLFYVCGQHSYAEDMRMKVITLHANGMTEKHIPLEPSCYILPPYDSSNTICSCTAGQTYTRVKNYFTEWFRVLTSSCQAGYAFSQHQDFQLLFFDGNGQLTHKLGKQTTFERIEISRTGVQSVEVADDDSFVSDAHCSRIEKAARALTQKRIEQVRSKYLPFKCSDESSIEGAPQKEGGRSH